ncbi:LysR family transcriptional regulator, partial [Phascolarctobacterium succinatutens]|uniref:LysR family transcriptional regulator n=1 Tax=Phascolarctobacterium succinatutens TaxID=626940 RepID=UPI00308088A7
FHTIVEAGGFNKAAEKLCYTQSTITFHVSQLEKELGVQLFEKAGRHMVLTKAGQELVPYVENVLQSVNNMKSFRSVIEECQGDIRGACLRNSRKIFGRWKHKSDSGAAIRKQAPRVHIYLDSMTSTSVYRAIRENKTDIGIFYDLLVDDATIKVVPYKDFDFVMFASPKIKKLYSDFITPNQDFSSLARICQPAVGRVRKRFDEYIKSKNFTMGPTIEIRGTQTIKNLVKNDMGICFLPKFTIQEELDKDVLVEIPIDKKFEPIHAVYAYRKDKWLSPPLKLFFQLLEQYKSLED